MKEYESNLAAGTSISFLPINFTQISLKFHPNFTRIIPTTQFHSNFTLSAWVSQFKFHPDHSDYSISPKPGEPNQISPGSFRSCKWLTSSQYLQISPGSFRLFNFTKFHPFCLYGPTPPKFHPFNPISHFLLGWDRFNLSKLHPAWASQIKFHPDHSDY